MIKLILKASNRTGFLFIVIGVLAFANLFSGVRLASKAETFAPDNAAAGVLFLALGLLLFGLSSVIRIFLRKRF